MKRITKEIKAVADAHIKASAEKNFTHPNKEVLAIGSLQELVDSLSRGETYAFLSYQAEMQFVTITSMMYSRVFEHQTEAYKKSMYKAFKVMFDNLESQGYSLPKAQ